MSEDDPIIITVTAESACAAPSIHTVTVTGADKVYFELADESEECSIRFDNDTFNAQIHPEVIQLTSNNPCRHVNVINAVAGIEGDYQILVGAQVRTCADPGSVGTPTMIIEGTGDQPDFEES